MRVKSERMIISLRLIVMERIIRSFMFNRDFMV